MEDLITVFRMTEIKPETRIKIIEKLGRLINDKYASNLTEDLVNELVTILKEEKSVPSPTPNPTKGELLHKNNSPFQQKD